MKNNKKLITLLVISVSLNLLFAGMIAGKIIGHKSCKYKRQHSKYIETDYGSCKSNLYKIEKKECMKDCRCLKCASEESTSE